MSAGVGSDDVVAGRGGADESGVFTTGPGEQAAVSAATAETTAHLTAQVLLARIRLC